jgi:deoxyribose-phosphate aldolase
VSKAGEAEIEKIVDTIARRVEAELEKRGRMPAAAPKAGSSSLPCDTCPVSSKCDSKTVAGSLNEGAKRISTSGAIEQSPCGHVAPYIDHTILKPDATREELKKVCDEARRFGFATVCVNSSNVRYVAACLEGSSSVAIAVVGFPLGAATTGAKVFETREAIRNGAKEIDMVINIGALKSKDYKYVEDDIRGVVEAAGSIPVKVILETSTLDRDQKVIASALSKAAGAAFVKTSTGFAGGGATVEDVALMRQVVGEDMGVKASGGVRTIDDAQRFIEAGASRIGASSSVAIVQCVKPKADDKAAAKPKAY